MILTSITYDASIYPAAEDFIYHLEIKNYQNRKVGLIENGSWAPSAGKKMKEHFEKMKNITLAEPIVTIKTTRKPADQEAFTALMNAMKN